MQHSHTTEDAFMVPGMGAQPVPPPKYVPANDNVPKADIRFFGTVTNYDAWASHAFSTRPGDPNGCADDLVTTTFAPLEELPTVRQPELTPAQVDEIYQWMTRHGDFMQTYTGRKFWPMDPRPQEVCIRDIAHSLSLQCRYAGHCRRFYSVAEHSVLIARWLRGQTNAQTALWGLLHDASEAYLIDVPRPVKPFLSGYKSAEENVMAAICQRFGLPLEMPAAVHEADERIIADELVNLVRMQWHARHTDCLGVTLQYWSPAEAEEEFLETFYALGGDRVGEVG